MTHLYTLLVGGIVIPGPAQPDASALAWAGDTVIAVGTEDDIRATSRGDSRIVPLDGACVVPAPDSGQVEWPPTGLLEVGGPADLAILAGDPRTTNAAAAGSMPAVIAIVHAGRIVTGSLPGADLAHEADHHDD